MTSGPIGPRPGSGLGPIGEFGDPLRPQEPQGPQPLPAMQGPPPSPAALPEPEQPDPATMVPEAPQQPVIDLGAAETRLNLMLATRSRALQTDLLNDRGEVVVPAMDPAAADEEALRQLADFVRRGPTIYPNKKGQTRKVDPKAELREYLMGGQLPIDWDAANRDRWLPIRSQQTIQEEAQQAAAYRGQRAAREFREDSPVLAGLIDYGVDPVTTFATSVAQVPVDIVSGLTNMAIAPFTDARIPPVELKRDLMTGATKLFTGGDPAALAFAQGNEQGFAETKSTGAELVEGAAGIAGMVRGMAGKVGGSVLGIGGQVGEATVRQVARMTGREANRFWTAVGRGSGSFGAYEGVAGKAVDETTGELRAPTLGERGANMLRGMVVGPIVEGANAAASKALMRLYGRGLAYSSPENKKAIESVLGWAKKQGYTKVVSETEEAFYGRVVRDYVSAGLPGARMSVRKAIGNVVRASVEGAGFASLDLFDAQYRAKLYQAVIEGDSEALSMMLMSWGQNALGLLFIHARSPGDVLRMMRRQPIEQPRQPEMFDWNSPLQPGVTSQPTGREVLGVDPSVARTVGVETRAIDDASGGAQGPVGGQGQYILGVAPDVARNVDAATGREIPQEPAQPGQPARPRQPGGIDPATGTIVEQGQAASAFEQSQAEIAERNRAWLEAFQARAPRRTVTDPATGTAMSRDVNPQREKATGTTLEGDDQPLDLGSRREILESAGWQASYASPRPVYSRDYQPEPVNTEPGIGGGRQSVVGDATMGRSRSIIGGEDIVAVSERREADKLQAEQAARRESWTKGYQPQRPQRTVTDPATGLPAQRDVAPQRERGTGTTLEGGQPIAGEEPRPGAGWEPQYAGAGYNPDAQPSRAVTIELPDTPHKVTVVDGVAKMASETAEWLGLVNNEVPVDVFADRAARATLLESVQGQVYLPGVAVLPGGVKIDAMGTLRQVRGGAIYQQKAEPGAKWEKAKEPVAVPKADTISPEQQATADALRYLMDQRTDLSQGDRVLLDATIQVMERVSPARDEGVADALQSIGAIADRLERGTPQEAAQAIDDLAEIMSQRAPEAVLARRNAKEAVAKADADFEAQRVAAEAEADNKATAEALGEKPAEPAAKPAEPVTEPVAEPAKPAEVAEPAAEAKPAETPPEPAKPAKAKKKPKPGSREDKERFASKDRDAIGYVVERGSADQRRKDEVEFYWIKPDKLPAGSTVTKMTRAEYEAKHGIVRSSQSDTPSGWAKGSFEYGDEVGASFVAQKNAQIFNGAFAVKKMGTHGTPWEATLLANGGRLPLQADTATRAREVIEELWKRMPLELRKWATDEAAQRESEKGIRLGNPDPRYRQLGQILESIAEEFGMHREKLGWQYTSTSRSYAEAAKKAREKQQAMEAERRATYEQGRDAERAKVDANVLAGRNMLESLNDPDIKRRLAEDRGATYNADALRSRLEAFDAEVQKDLAKGHPEREAILRAADAISGIAKNDAVDSLIATTSSLEKWLDQVKRAGAKPSKPAQRKSVTQHTQQDLVSRLKQMAESKSADKSQKARAAKLASDLAETGPQYGAHESLMADARSMIATAEVAAATKAVGGMLGKGSARDVLGKSLLTRAIEWADALATHPQAANEDRVRLHDMLDIQRRFKHSEISLDEMIAEVMKLTPKTRGSSGSSGLLFTPGDLAEDARLVARAAANVARSVQRGMTSFYSYAFEPTWRYLQRFGTGRFVNTARDIELRGNELSGQAERLVTPAITEYRRLRAESRGAIDEVRPNDQGAMEPAWLDLVEGRRQPTTEREAAVAANGRQALLTMWEQLRAAGAVRTVLNAEGNIEYRRFDERENATVPRYPGRDHDAMMGDPALRLRYWDAQAARNPATIIDAETGRPRPRTGQDLVDAMMRSQSAGTTIDAIQRQANAEIARELHNLDYTFEGREIWSTDFELVMEQTHMQQPRRAAWIERNGPGVPPDVAQRLGIEQNIDPDALFLEYAQSLNTGSQETSNVLLQQARDYAQILQGRNPHLKDTRFTRFMRKVQPIENMARASLTGVKAALWDLPAAALMPVLYSRRGEWARLLFEFADPEQLRENWREAYEHAFRIGMISRSVSSHDQAVPASLRGLGRLTRILNRPSEISEQFKGAAAFRVGNFLLERWDAGGATESDRNLLRILRLPQRFAEGQLTEAERNTFLLEYGKQVTARTDLAGASALAADPGMRMHIRFLRWATRAMHNAGRIVQAVGEAQTPAERRAAWERVAKMGLIYTASGLAGKLLGTVFADAFQGENGFERFWRELTASPMAAIKGALTSFTSQVTGGAVSTLLGFAGDPSAENMARLTVLSQYGYTAVKGAQGLADALWSYSTGEARKDPHSLSQFIHNTGLLPLSREIAGTGQMLHARLHGYEALRQDREMARWFERMADIPKTFGERKWPQAYYDKLEEMARAVSAGARPGEWIRDNLDSLKAVLEVAPTESLAQAMRARQLVSNWSAADRKRFADTINDPERVRRIYEFDSTVREMANEIRKLEGARPTGFSEQLENVTSQAHLGASDQWNRLVEIAVDDAVAGQPGSILELADKLALFPHQLDQVFRGEMMQRRLERTTDVASRAWLIRQELEMRARQRMIDERRQQAKERRNQ